MIKIEITPLKLENQEPYGGAVMYLELHDTFVRMVINFMAKEPINNDDKMMGWEDVRNDYDTIALKSSIAGIEKQWIHKSKKWGIYIMINGFGADIKWYYKLEAKANETYKIVQEWLIGTPIV